ncbi:TIGR02710 family CRISPR-associated CARF protein [Thermodesulfovibrionales bacterium]|nr:TIGR02710 family CRISPR-associated CARF protein [Thermodesulfovibrionales bacterium]
MPKAMIVTVGAQGEQIIFSLKEINPEYVGLLGTETPECEGVVNHILKEYEISPTKYKYFSFPDHAGEIGKLINKFQEIYDWLTKDKGVSPEDIIFDSTGGRKWMSAGATMIASFLGLNMIYVDAKYRNGKLDSSTMEITPLGNAYEQTGFLEEHKADKLFNEYNFTAAIAIYDFLSKKLQDPRRILIKKNISESYLNWTQFKFKQGYEFLSAGMKKIKQYQMLLSYKNAIERQVKLLDILRKNDEMENNNPKYPYFKLLEDKDFTETILLFLYSQQSRFAENKQFEQAVIILYRILEFIAQLRLAYYDIDTNNITREIQKKYNPEFRRITKVTFQGETEIPDKIALVHGWILLYCLKDQLLKKEKEEFLKGLREQVKKRDLLWSIHRNQGIDETGYREFKKYVRMWISKIDKNFEEKLTDFQFIKL